MKTLWETTKVSGKNPSATAGFFNSYDVREFTPEEVLARESAQNAVDAGRRIKGTTQLEFHKLRLAGPEKIDFIKAYQFDSLLSERADIFARNPRNDWLAENITRFLDDEAISILLVRDFNTVGLGGKWDRYNRGVDHFARLVCATNLDDKADNDPNSGGSFGLGKTNYAKSSIINTVIYHSVFKRDELTNQKNRRLMVAGVYPRHEMDGEIYSGFAYFGEPVPDLPQETKPFEDEDASELWDVLAKSSGRDLTRKENEYGTDIAIVMDSLDLPKIRTAIEDYYFPAIIDGNLAVKFVDEDGSVEFPRVRERKDLDQFIRLVEKAKSGIEDKTETLKVTNFNKRFGYKLGAYAFETAEPDEAQSSKKNTVAIMRQSGFILNYIKLGSDKYEPAVGAFVADEEIYKFLGLAENSAHSEWNENAWRLREDADARPIVKHLNSNLSSHFINFQRQLQPDVSQSRTENGLLAKLLASALSGNVGDDDVPPGVPNPVAISLQQRNREESLSVWRLQVHDNEHTPSEPFTLKIFPSISLAGDKKLVPIKHMEFRVKNADGQIIEQGTKPEIIEIFERGRVLDFGVEFENPGRKNFVVQCKFVAELGALDV